MQVAQCQDHLGLLVASIGVGCSNQMCSLHKGHTLMQILPLCYLHLVDIVQLALVVFPSITSTNATCTRSTCTHGGHHLLQVALVEFFLGALVLVSP